MYKLCSFSIETFLVKTLQPRIQGTLLAFYQNYFCLILQNLCPQKILLLLYNRNVILDTDGQLINFYGSWRNITERRLFDCSWNPSKRKTLEKKLLFLKLNYVCLPHKESIIRDCNTAFNAVHLSTRIFAHYLQLIEK